MEHCVKRTDLTRWRLKDDDSRHTWHYLDNEAAEKDWPQSHAEKYYLDLPLVRISCSFLFFHQTGVNVTNLATGSS